MMFGSKVKQLCEELQLPQRKKWWFRHWNMTRQLYSSIELERRNAQRTQIPILAKVLKTNENELVALWLADKIVAAIGEEKENELVTRVLDVCKKQI
jgi:hypothetical protein